MIKYKRLLLKLFFLTPVLLYAATVELPNNIILSGADVWNKWITQNRNKASLFGSLGHLQRLLLSHCDLKQIFISKIKFDYSKMQFCQFQSASIDFSSFSNVDLRNSNFTNTAILETNFCFANMRGVKFQCEYIINCNFTGTNLEKVDFSKVTFSATKYIIAKKIVVKPIVFKGANLKSANLSNKGYGHLSRVNFLLCNLENTNFRNSDLRQANFTRAYIKNADFTNTNLDSAVFEKKWKTFLERFKTSAKNWDKIKWVDNQTDFNPYTNNALVLAAKNGNAAECIRLLKLGALPDSAVDGVPALIWACYKGHLKIAELLIQNGADVNIVDRDIDTPLIAATFANKPDIVKLLLKQKKIKAEFKNFNGRTAFDIANEKGFTEIAGQISLKINNVDLRTFELNKNLLNSVYSGDIEAVISILKKGANINAKNEEGYSSIEIACQFGNIEMIKTLANAGADLRLHNSMAIIFAGGINSVEILRFLISKGANVNAYTELGNTALRSAVVKGYLNNVRYLLSIGAKVNDKNNNSFTLVKAAENGHIEIMKLLLNAGANVNTIDYYKKTALMYVSESGYNEVARILINKGANLNLIDRQGFTALMYAAGKGNLNIVRLLVESGADMNIKRIYGITALRDAEVRGHRQVVEYLRSRGAQ